MKRNTILEKIQKCKIDEVHKLDWLLFHRHCGEIKVLPEVSGVYVFYSINPDNYKTEILYAGSAVNLRRRISAHEITRVLRSLDRYNNYVFIRVHFCSTEEMLGLEKKLIKGLRPNINRDYNDKQTK